MVEAESFIERLNKIVKSDKLTLDVEEGMLVWKNHGIVGVTIFANQRGRYGIAIDKGWADDKDVYIIEDEGVVSETVILRFAGGLFGEPGLRSFTTDLKRISDPQDRPRLQQKADKVLALVEGLLV